MYFATVACETSIPCFRSSPWIRGAPHSTFIRLMVRIRSRVSFETVGRPVLPCRIFLVQYDRKPCRCQAMTVAGFTMTKAERQSDHSRESQTQTIDPIDRGQAVLSFGFVAGRPVD